MKQKQPINFTIGLIMQEIRGKNAIELRTCTTNPECMKQIIEAALLEKPIAIFPIFRDRLLALATLSEKGILKYDYDKEQYSFLI